MPFEFHTREQRSATIIELVGTGDSSLPTQTRQRLLSLIKPGGYVVVDLSRLSRVSGTGLMWGHTMFPTPFPRMREVDMGSRTTGPSPPNSPS